MASIAACSRWLCNNAQLRLVGQPVATGLVVLVVACEAVLRDGELGCALSFSITRAANGMLWHKLNHILSKPSLGQESCGYEDKLPGLTWGFSLY